MKLLDTVVLSLALCGSAPAETVDVKYRRPVDLKPFVCTDTKGRFVNRICYEQGERVHAYSVKADLVSLLRDTCGHFVEANWWGLCRPVLQFKRQRSGQQRVMVLSIADANDRIEDWRRQYNQERSHSTLGNLTPNAVADQASKARKARKIA